MALSDGHTTALVGGLDVPVSQHPAAVVARAGPSGPAFGRYDDADGERDPEAQRRADETAFPAACGGGGPRRCLGAR